MAALVIQASGSLFEVDIPKLSRFPCPAVVVLTRADDGEGI